VLAGIDTPGDAFEDGAAATEVEVGDFENRGGHEEEGGYRMSNDESGMSNG
jgi:hypothetical protein